MNSHYSSDVYYYSRHQENFNIRKQVVSKHFEKKFHYKKANWELPPLSEFFAQEYTIDEFQKLKTKLNEVKSKLNDYPIENWSSHTDRRNPAGKVTGYLKNKVKAEFVTQGWSKFFECLHQYPLAPEPKLCSVHLCEAPGAFIAALNHYMHSTYSNIDWNWLSTTLNPYYEGNALSNMVTDDRFILHTLDRWMFGTDFTGNIMNSENIEDMARLSKEMGKVTLVTADGSIDCMENPESQEEIVFPLHYAEICAALRILSEGGSLVVKMFTLFEASSISLMFLLNCLFRDVHVYKPATSKSGNSEAYIICLKLNKNIPGYDDVIQKIMEKVGQPNIPPLFSKESIPEDFITQHGNCVRFFMNLQTEMIESNIEAFAADDPNDIQFCQTLRSLISNRYIRRFKVRRLPVEKTILFERHATVHYEFHRKVHRGSYTERCQVKIMSSEEKVAILRNQLDELLVQLQWPYERCTEDLGEDSKKLKINIYLGKPIAKVYSSLFANLHLMHMRSKISSIGMDISTLSCHKSRCQITSLITNQSTEVSPTEIENNTDREKRFVQSIISRCLEIDATRVVFKDVLFLTHFLVSIVRHLWANVFQKLTISSDHEVILEGLKDDGKDKLQELNLILSVNNVLCLVNIGELHKNSFSSAIINHNNALLLSTYRENLMNSNFNSEQWKIKVC